MPEWILALSDIQLLALCIWSEARDEPIDGQVAVANVVMNRVKAKSWYGATVREVVLKPYQFSWFNEPSRYPQPMPDHFCVIAEMAIWKLLSDPTDGATHYHARYIATLDWARNMKVTTVIGQHIFYK